MRYLALLLIICFGLSQVCSAGTISPDTSDQKYLDYGKKHACVLPIVGTLINETTGDLNQYVGSCVVLDKRIIITAAHIIAPAKTSKIIFGKKQIEVDFALYQKSYKYDGMGDNDLALCALKEDINLDYYPKLYAEDDEIGKVCSISGYGMTGNHRTGVTKNDGKKRAGSNVIKGIANGMLYCSLKDSPTSLEFLVANGDSGGGLFIHQKLAGINSCIMTTDGKLDSNYNDEYCHKRISMHKKWIDEQIKKIKERLEKK